jgi:hypothetical protein
MSNVTIQDTNNIDRIKRNLRDLDRKSINVGLTGSADSELVMIAGVHEFGTEIQVTDKMRKWFAANGFPLKKSTTKIVIPERSFLRSGYDENIDDIADKIEELVPQVLENRVAPSTFMDMIGLEFAGLIQKKLRDLRNPANSSMTTQRKGSTNPLIDTGRLVGAIRHEIE